MAIRKSSVSGTPFGNTASRPSSPQVGQTYYNGDLGYLEIYTDAGWIPATGANDFSLNLSGTHTSINLAQSYSSGSYSIVSASNDTTMDIYAYATDGSLVGYTNNKSFTANQRFTKLVILGGSSGDVLSFSYKTTYPTSASTSDVTAGPYITSVSPSGMPNQNDTITITGGNFASNVTVNFTGAGYSSTAAKNVVRSSSTSLIVTRPDNFPISGAPYTVTVTNPSVANQPTGSNSHIHVGITAGNVPVWQTPSTVNDTFVINNASSLTLSATDADGGSSVTYSYISGSLPTGLSFNAETGVISGTATVLNQSTNYTVRATDSGGNSADRTFTITVIYPTVSGGTLTADSTYYYRTFTGNGTASINGAITADILLIAGGGSGGASFGGGGGAGGVVYATSRSINTGSYPIVIGGGGNSTIASNNIRGNNGIDSTAFSLTAIGGGGGGSYESTSTAPGLPGGSGGGVGSSETSTNFNGGAATQSSGTGFTGYGNAGGNGFGRGGYVGAGGGGSGSAGGEPVANTRGGHGGSGLNNWSSWATVTGTGVSGFYAGGGAGAAYTFSGNGTQPGNAGSGGGGSSTGASSGAGGAATANTGSGGGGAGYPGGISGQGGSGICIIRYTRASVGG